MIPIFIAYLCILTFASESRAAEPLKAKGDLYSESFLDTFRHLGTNSSRFRLKLPVTSFAAPYVVIGDEYTAPNKGGELQRAYEWSYYYTGAGLELSIPGVQLYLESRHHFFADMDAEDVDGASTYENRALLVLSHWWDKPMSWGGSLFADAYGEALATSLDTDNRYFDGYVRLGQRVPLGAQYSTDFYLRPYFLRDQKGEPFQNRNELEAGFRFNAHPGWLDMSVGSGYVWSETFSAHREGFERLKQQGWRFAFILGRAVQ